MAGAFDGSLQGDAGLVDVLARMGCRVVRREAGIEIQGGELRGVDVDMGHMPDLVPTLAVVAANERSRCARQSESIRCCRCRKSRGHRWHRFRSGH